MWPTRLNLYTYARNNPITKTDLGGHCGISWDCLKNWLHYGVWVGNDDVEGALKKEAGRDRTFLAGEQISVDGKKLTSDYLNTLSNKDVYDLFWGYIDAKVSGDLGVEVHYGGHVFTADVHHLLPQAKEFRKYFDDADLNIHDYTIDLPRDFHIDIHSGKGMGSGGAWNNAWREFFRQNPNASGEQILEQMNRMVDEFGLRPYDFENLLKDGEGPVE